MRAFDHGPCDCWACAGDRAPVLAIELVHHDDVLVTVTEFERPVLLTRLRRAWAATCRFFERIAYAALWADGTRWA